MFYEYFLTMCTAWVYSILRGVFSVFVYENIQVFFGVPFRCSMQIFKLTLLAMVQPFNAKYISWMYYKVALLFVHSYLEFTPAQELKLRGHSLTKVTDYTVIFSKFCDSTLCFCCRGIVPHCFRQAVAFPFLFE